MKLSKKISTALTILLIFFIRNASAQNDGAANTGLSFLKFGAGARAIAMGDAYSSVADDATAYIYNPARLNFGIKSNLTLMHNISAQDLSTDFIAIKFPLSDKVAMGVGFFTTSVTGIQIRNIPGAEIDNFDTRNLSTGVSFGYKITPNFSMGITGKFLFEKIYVDEASGLAFDFGTNYSKDNFNIALVVSNVGSMNELKSASSELPALIRFGGSYSNSKNDFSYNLALEGFKVFDGGTFHVYTGGEAGYKQFVFLRMGYQSSYENRGLTTGVGFKYKTLNLDYAFTPSVSEFGTGNTISLGINF
jgi:hypothetical protein